MINRDRLIRTFLDMVKINSPSKNERGVADYLKLKLEKLGYDVIEDDAGEKVGGNAGNLIATKMGTLDTGTRVFFSAHMDTVEPTEGIDVTIEDDGVIKTDGKTILGADCKAGIAAVLEAAQCAEEQNIAFNSIQFVFSISEEIGLLGAKLVDPALIKADVGYVFDTGKPVAGVVTSAPTHANLLIKVIGRASHAGIDPEGGVSAIIAASRAIANMKLGRIDEETTANVGVIKGGKARNIVPDYVEIRAEARSRNEEKLKAQVDHMIKTFTDAAREMGADVDIEAAHEYYTYRWTRDDAPVQLALRAGARMGIKPELVEGGGGSDANVFNHIGLPAVVIGVGYDGAHAKTENITVDDLVKAAEYAKAIIEESGNVS